MLQLLDALQSVSTAEAGPEQPASSFEAQLGHKAAALAASVRLAREREAHESRERLAGALNASHAAFYAALEQHQHWDAAAALGQLRTASEQFDATSGTEGARSQPCRCLPSVSCIFHRRSPAPDTCRQQRSYCVRAAAHTHLAMRSRAAARPNPLDVPVRWTRQHGTPACAGAAETGAAADAALQEMQAALLQHLSTTLWQYYLFVQSEGPDWAQAALTVHAALAGAQLFDAAGTAGLLNALCEEVATYLHQYVGARRHCEANRVAACTPCHARLAICISSGCSRLALAPGTAYKYCHARRLACVRAVSDVVWLCSRADAPHLGHCGPDAELGV